MPKDKPTGAVAPAEKSRPSRNLITSVAVFDADSEEKTAHFVRNLAKPENMDWLRRAIIHGLNNKKLIEIQHIDDLSSEDRADLDARFRTKQKERDAKPD